MMVSVTALALSFAVHTANYFFYTDGRLNGKGAKDFVNEVASVNADTMKYLFPYVKPKETEPPVHDLSVPDNMTFTAEEFAQFKGTYLERTADAGDAYLHGITYCGDSLTYAMGLDSRFLSDCDVVSWGGLGVYNFLDYGGEKVYNQSDEIMTPFECLGKLKPDVLYIMFGTNGMAICTNEQHINYYRTMLNRIQTLLPKAKIVVVGIPGWGKEHNTDTFNGKKFDDFNMKLLQLAKEQGVYYLNFAEVARDKNGNIRSDLVLGDGIHWENACKRLYLDYIKTHALP